MPSVVYLCIALFAELFNLARCDVPVLVTVSALVESQASADPAFPRSWIITHKPLSLLTHCTQVKFPKKLRAGWKARNWLLYLSWAAVTTQWNFITKCHTALNHHWSARRTYWQEKNRRCSYNSLSSRRSVMSNSKEGKILLNILKSLPKRGIWMIRQEGAWGNQENVCSRQQSSADILEKLSAHKNWKLRISNYRSVWVCMSIQVKRDDENNE